MFAGSLRSRILPLLVVGVLALGMLLGACGRSPAPPAVMRPIAKQPIVFSVDPSTGQANKPPHTQVVPTLDTPIDPGKNVIWCASFTAAWKHLQKDLAGGPVQVEGAEDFCRRLNAAPEPFGDMASSMFYAVAGWADKGILETIHKEMAERFPTVPQPTFPDIVPNSFVAYAYLCAHLPFTIPYFENDEPLSFTDSAGNVTPVGSFGIREKDEFAYRDLRRQVKVLYTGGGGSFGNPGEFALDLCQDSKPNQIVVACVPFQKTLAATLQYVFSRIPPPVSDGQPGATPREAIFIPNRESSFGPNDAFLIPNLWYRIDHPFDEIMGRYFQNPELRKQRIDVALQTIEFRLDRSGAELNSEAKMYMKPVPTFFFANRPFLIYMKVRNADGPFFVMWVDNAELLDPWPAK